MGLSAPGRIRSVVVASFVFLAALVGQPPRAGADTLSPIQEVSEAMKANLSADVLALLVNYGALRRDIDLPISMSIPSP